MSLVGLLLLGACTSKGDDSTPVDTQPVETDTDTAPAEPTPVWEDRHIETSATLNGIYVSGAGIYVGGTGGVVLASQSDGSWDDFSPDVAETDIGDVWGESNGASLVLVVGAGDGRIAWYAGGTWVVDDVGTAAAEGVGGSASTGVFVVTWGGAYFRSGSTWTYESVPGNPKLNDVYGIGTDAIAVGEAGAAAIRRGGAWEALSTGTTADLSGVSGVSMSDVWAVGGEGTALHYDGTSWTATDTGTTQTLWAVWAASASAVFAVGNGGTALKWDGSAWTALPTGVDNNLYAVHGTDGTNVYAGGNRGGFIHYAG